MDTINRSAIVARPAQPFLDWLHRVDPTGSHLKLEDLQREPAIYLLAECDNQEQAMEYLGEGVTDIFEEQRGEADRVARALMPGVFEVQSSTFWRIVEESSPTYVHGKRTKRQIATSLLQPAAAEESMPAFGPPHGQPASPHQDGSSLVRTRGVLHFALDGPSVEPKATRGCLVAAGLSVNQRAVAAQQLLRGEPTVEQLIGQVSQS